MKEESSNQTILLVEDDEDISFFMTEVLAQATPYEAVSVPDATSALGSLMQLNLICSSSTTGSLISTVLNFQTGSILLRGWKQPLR